MDDHQGLIFYLYIALNQTLDDVIKVLKTQHGLDVSRNQLNKQLKIWKYPKNLKKEQVVTVLREKNRRQAEGKAFDFSIQSRPANLDKIERSGQRAGYFRGALQQEPHGLDMPMVQISCRTPPPTTSVSLLRREQWRIPEKILFDVNGLIRGSFESGLWIWNGRDRLIESSKEQHKELPLLSSFLGTLASGCEAADANDFILAVSFWDNAFDMIEHLVQGQYHDIIPNLIQKINDLNREGRHGLAKYLQQKIAECGRTFFQPNSPTTTLYVELGDLDMDHMIMVEDLIMECYNERFHFYLGPKSYNSFVMMMDCARRKLFRDAWVRLEDVLPPVDLLDRAFGVSDRRSLDVIGLRIEVAQKRKWFFLIESEAPILIHRARLIENDDWQKFYNLTRGWFALGSVQYFVRKKSLAIVSLNNALASDDSLRGVAECNIFDVERLTVARYLEDMSKWT